MANIRYFAAGCLVVAAVTLGCGREEKSSTEEKKSGAQRAVEQAITQDFKIYEGAKKALGKIEKESEERQEEIEKGLK